MNALASVQPLLQRLLQTQKYAALATDNHGQPYTSLMAFSVTAQCVAEEIAGAERAGWREFCLIHHPALRGFATSPTCALSRIKVNCYRVVGRFQEVSEWRLSTQEHAEVSACPVRSREGPPRQSRKRFNARKSGPGVSGLDVTE